MIDTKFDNNDFQTKTSALLADICKIYGNGGA